MADIRTADEQKIIYVEKMGEDLGKVFHALWQEVAWLHSKWEEYVVLFGTKPSRIDLVNEAAPLFFRIVQDLLFEETLLHIARLTDPPKSAGKENLTIRMLPSLINKEKLKIDIQSRVDLAIDKAGFCRDWRNRRIAHHDFELALKEGATPLQPASREKVKAALEAIVSVLDAVTLHYFDSSTAFDTSSNRGGAESLIYVLDDGLKAKAERIERRKSGEVDPKDFTAHDL